MAEQQPIKHDWHTQRIDEHSKDLRDQSDKIVKLDARMTIHENTAIAILKSIAEMQAHADKNQEKTMEQLDKINASVESLRKDHNDVATDVATAKKGLMAGRALIGTGGIAGAIALWEGIKAYFRGTGGG